MKEKKAIRLGWIIYLFNVPRTSHASHVKSFINHKVISSRVGWQLKMGILAGYKMFIISYLFSRQIDIGGISIVYKAPNKFYDKYNLS